MTYAFTPPGILTSTRTSTRENALKQLHRGYKRVHKTDQGVVGAIIGIQTHQKQPFFTFQVAPFVNHACDSSMEYVRELMYAASDADDDVSTPET